MRLNREKFECWLRSKPEDAIVGMNRDTCGCPIARFYYDASGGCEVSISDDGDGMIIDRGYERRRPPAWAAAFIFLVDGLMGPHITAKQALDVLAKVAA